MSEASAFLHFVKDRGFSWDPDQLNYFNQPKPINMLRNFDGIKSMPSVGLSPPGI